MKIFPAKSFDIPEIMKIERAAFIPAIQEKQKTFEERLRTFPEGFLLLADNSPQTVLENKGPLIAGYFTSEIWNFIPQSDEIFTLGHSAQKTHDREGSVLYFSSFALLPSFQGKKLAEPFLTGCLDSICGGFPKIKHIVLLVNAEWQGAKHLYEKLGFKEVRRIKNFFPSLKQEASDGIIMQKSVNSRDANC
ncbi:N-acetyltransferase [uncultured Treponema sp.]|uniref:GNAT family N-acetyltransferase n=1 Tax=uncultured Treponema sp. TaxID=162155 RepID=UPI0015BFBAE6|nr:N-acetyltransferase [uncultured Treponema sp.]